MPYLSEFEIPLDQVNYHEVMGLDDTALKTIPIKEFNKLLKEKNFGKIKKDEIKKWFSKKRRTLMNKGYAKGSRKKKDDEMESFKKDIVEIQKEIDKLPTLEQLQKDYNDLRESMEDLTARCGYHDIILSDDSDDSLSGLK